MDGHHSEEEQPPQQQQDVEINRLQRLEMLNPRNIHELLIPGLRDRPPDDPYREHFQQFTPAEVAAAVKDTIGQLKQYERRVDGCLICAGDASVEDFSEVGDVFKALRPVTKRRKVSGRFKMTLQQRIFLRTRYMSVDGRLISLCIKHIYTVFGVRDQPLRAISKCTLEELQSLESELLNDQDMEEDDDMDEEEEQEDED